MKSWQPVNTRWWKHRQLIFFFTLFVQFKFSLTNICLFYRKKKKKSTVKVIQTNSAQFSLCFLWLWAQFPGPLLPPPPPHPALVNNKQINISKVLLSDAAQPHQPIKGTLPCSEARSRCGPGSPCLSHWKPESALQELVRPWNVGHGYRRPLGPSCSGLECLIGRLICHLHFSVAQFIPLQTMH